MTEKRNKESITNPLSRTDVEEYILCAAIWYKDGEKYQEQPLNIDSGYVLCGRRHSNCISNAFVFDVSLKEIEHEQGFLTSRNRFLNREEAAKIANEAGQTLVETNHLLSEHLY